MKEEEKEEEEEEEEDARAKTATMSGERTPPTTTTAGATKVVDLGPQMWRELCLRSEDRGALDHDHSKATQLAFDAERRHLSPALQTNHELSTPEYFFTLPTAALRRGVTAPGGPRMARLIAKLEAGEPIKVASLGGSVTSTAGCWGGLDTCAPTHSPLSHGTYGEGWTRQYERTWTRPTWTDHHDGTSVRYFMRRFMDGVNRTWPHRGHRLYNSAKPGSVPEYFSACLLAGRCSGCIRSTRALEESRSPGFI